MSNLPARLSPSPVRTLGRRVTRSQLIADLSRHGWLPLWWALVLVLAVLVGLLSHGWVLTWDGYIPADLPAVPANCGDYCGTDAGLLGG